MAFFKNFKQKQLLGYFLIAGLIFLLDFWVIFNPIKNVFTWLFGPLRNTTYQLSQVNLEQVFYSKKLKSLKYENQQLERELMAITGEMINYQQIADENKRLKSLINSPLEKDLFYYPAQVVSSREDYLIINRGERNNVFVGQLAVEGHYLVGQVTEVFNREAKILKLGSASLELPVLIFSDQNNCLGEPVDCQKGRGIIAGEVVKEIFREEEVMVGDLVTLLDGPKGILLGKVSQVQEGQDQIFKQARIEKLINPNRVTEIFLISP